MPFVSVLLPFTGLAVRRLRQLCGLAALPLPVYLALLHALLLLPLGLVSAHCLHRVHQALLRPVTSLGRERRARQPRAV